MHLRRLSVVPVRRHPALIGLCLAALALIFSLAPGRVALAQTLSFTQDQQLVPTDFTLPQPFVRANGQYGASVAMSADGAWMVVGAPAPATPAGVGHTFVYERVAVLNAAEAVAGEPGATIAGCNGAGRVHFFGPVGRQPG
jgi:hypothetical protein